MWPASGWVRIVFLFPLLLSILPGRLAGQSWSLDTYAGRANYDTTPATVNSATAALGVRYSQDRRIFRATAGAPLSDQDVTWGVIELGDRVALRRGGLVTGADISLLAHGHRDPLGDVSGKGLLGEILPLISHNVGAGIVEFRSGIRWYGSELGDTDWTRTLWTTDVRGSVEPTSRLRVEGNLRHDRAGQGENYTRPGLSVSSFLGRVSVAASAGHWINNPNDSSVDWGLSVGIPVHSRVWLISGVHHETFDPTFLVSPRTNWGVGLSFQLGGTSRSTDSNDPQARERVVIRLPLRDSSTTPSIAGDFTDWKPVRMDRYEQEWRLTVSLARGVYHFSFRSEDGVWFVPPDFANRVDDGLGGHAAVLVIP